MLIRNLLILVLVLLYFVGGAQSILVEETELYRDDVLPRIDIFLPADSLDWLYDSDNLQSNIPLHATFVFDNGAVNDTIENIGFRLRGNTSRNADKKSFKVDLNAFVKGQTYYGVEKINLNGQHNDPTISRAKLCSYLGEEMELVYMRTNHVELYINGAYHGLYTNVEHIDERFVEKRFEYPAGNLYKCLYPADLNYKSDNPDAYKQIINGRRAYDLKTNTEEDNYDDLAKFIDILNNSSSEDLPCNLEKVFNVDRYLKYIVFDILTGNWDGPIYNKNNFYLYFDLSTERFEYIPYDLDNTLGIDWLNKDWGTRNMYAWSHSDEDRPLYSKILEVPEYRARFSYYMEEALIDVYESSEFEIIIDEIIAQIESSVDDDQFYTLDYGFDVQDFLDAFSESLPYFQTDYGVLDFISKRREECFDQLDSDYNASPIISNLNYNIPVNGEMLYVQGTIVDDGFINQAEICFTTPGGQENCFQMWDDGNHEDANANDGIFGSDGMLIDIKGKYSFYLQVEDNNGKEQRYPRCEDKVIHVNESNFDLRINEFMAKNDASFFDEADEADDWIELYNNSSNVIYLEGLYLSDNSDKPFKYRLSDIVIVPGLYKVFWADNDPEQGINHMPFKLSGSDGFVGLYRKNAEGAAVVIDQITYGAQETDISFARIPNGTGPFELSKPTPGYFNEALSLISDNQQQTELSVFPNPSNGEIQLEVEYTNQNISVVVYNSLGQKVKTCAIKGGVKHNMILEASGLYYITFKVEGKLLTTQKLVVSK